GGVARRRHARGAAPRRADRRVHRAHDDRGHAVLHGDGASLRRRDGRAAGAVDGEQRRAGAGGAAGAAGGDPAALSRRRTRRARPVRGQLAAFCSVVAAWFQSDVMFVPTSWTAAITAIVITASAIAYSARSCPRSSRINRLANFISALNSRHSAAWSPPASKAL